MSSILFKNTKTTFYSTLIVAIICINISSTIAQVSFTNPENILKESFYSGIAMGVVDMNGDHLDDLLILDNANDLYIIYQRENGHYFNAVHYEQYLDLHGAYSICVGDINNDFINDYILGYTLGGHVYINNIIDSEHLFSTKLDVFLQGSNFIDFDHDGLLDLYVSNDVGLNKLYRNTGNGYELQEDWIDFTTAIESDNSGNYGSEWIDIDNDCDLDLYISKCRAGVLTPTDPRRINALYINDGNDNYTESASSFGLATGAQSWSTNFGDLDNDGDLDAFIVNHDDYFMLLENEIENDTFILHPDYIPEIDDPLFAIGFEGMLCDFNNDTYLDILITGHKDFLLINNGNMEFTKIDEPFGVDNVHSLGIGDLNNDGSMDILASFAIEINTPSNYKDKIFLNDGNENKYAKFTLTGIESNINAIGTRISIYGDWGIQIRTIRAGESYGIANSFTQHFGLGLSTSIDSIVVRWPDCKEMVFSNLSANQHYFITENGGITTRIPLEILGDIDLCESDSVTLVAGEGSQYIWSNGETTRSITTNIRGSFFCRYLNTDGFLTWSNNVDVSYSEVPSPTVITNGTPTTCIGNSITLHTETADNYLWSTGETTSTITVNSPGSYQVSTQHGCQQFTSEPVIVTFLDTNFIEIINDTIYKGESANLQAIGDSVSWYNNIEEEEAFHIGNNYNTPLLEESTNYYVVNNSYQLFNSQYVGLENMDKPEFLLYSNNSLNTELIFDVFESILLKSVKVRTDSAGMRKIELKNNLGIVIDSKEVMIDTGTTRILLYFDISPGQDYELTTNKIYNVAHLGFESPRLWRENFQVQFPYKIENLVTITTTGKGNAYYYYFLDWEIQKSPIHCESERTLISAIVDTTTSLTHIDLTNGVIIYPNPADKLIHINSKNKIQNYEIYNQVGKTIVSRQYNNINNTINIESLNKGIHFIRFNIASQWVYKKIIKY